MRKHFGVTKVFHIFIEVVVTLVIKLKSLHFIACRISSINFISNKQNCSQKCVTSYLDGSPQTSCRETTAGISIIWQMPRVLLSCLKAHVIPVGHFFRPFITQRIHVHSWSGFPSQLQGRSGTDMELLDTSSQEVTLWGSGRAAGHYSRGRSIFGTVSSPYQEACTLGTSALHNGREAEPHPDGTGMLEAFCSCRKKHSVVCSKKKKKKWWLRWGILQKGTDGDLCAPCGTKTFGLWNAGFQCPVCGGYDDSFFHVSKT